MTTDRALPAWAVKRCATAVNRHAFSDWQIDPTVAGNELLTVDQELAQERATAQASAALAEFLRIIEERVGPEWGISTRVARASPSCWRTAMPTDREKLVECFCRVRDFTEDGDTLSLCRFRPNKSPVLDIAHSVNLNSDDINLIIAALSVTEAEIRADEREACAKWHDERAQYWKGQLNGRAYAESHQASAAAIRAREEGK